uniref:Lipid-binding serum glycoprotein N-terminal domain-containing protein n=1 Tax=Otolemur garnettii TaxID=30611 RepID=H0X3D6_OTOGA
MLPIWALAIMLAVQARALDLQAPPEILKELPVQLPGPNIGTLPLGVPYDPIPRVLPSSRPSTPRKISLRTKGRRCSPMAKYFISPSKLEDYLDATLPLQIEKKLKCEKVNLAGLFGSLISKLSDSTGLLSLLNLTSSLDLIGGAGLNGILGQGGNDKSPKVPLLSEATSAVGDLLPLGQEGLGSLLPIGADKNPVNGLLKGTGLSSLQQPLNDVVGKAGQLTDSTQDVLSSVVPSDISETLTGLLGNINVEQLLLGLEVQKVTVDSMKSTMADDGIQMHVTTTAFIGGKGVAGPVVDLLGFQVHGNMALQIGISTNNTHCVKLQVLEKSMTADKVTLQLPEKVTEILPVSLPVPLDDIVPQLLTISLNENTEEPSSCDIVLSDGSDCKNSTGLFTYILKSSRMSTSGLSTVYCAEARFKKNRVPMTGSPLSPDTKNANASLTLSHTILKTIVTYAAKMSSLQKGNVDGSITKVSYSLQPGNKIQATYWVNIRKDGESFATGQTSLIISHLGRISKDRLIADIKLVSSEHSSTPPEAIDEVQVVMADVLKKFWSNLTELLQRWNIPPGVISNLLDNTKVEVLKSVREKNTY